MVKFINFVLIFCGMFKQVILIRSDLKMGKGKIAAQAAHASVEAVLRSSKDKVASWRAEGMKKVALKVGSKEEIFKFENLARSYGLVASIIKDAGRTEIEPGTITCMAIGPDRCDLIDKVTKDLKMF